MLHFYTLVTLKHLNLPLWGRNSVVRYSSGVFEWSLEYKLTYLSCASEVKVTNAPELLLYDTVKTASACLSGISACKSVS